jgi:hypothetical protein
MVGLGRRRALGGVSVLRNRVLDRGGIVLGGARRVRVLPVFARAKIRVRRVYEVRSEPQPERAAMPELRQRELDLEELAAVVRE